MDIVQEKTKSKIVCHTGSFDPGTSDFHWHENCEICQIIDKPCRILVDGDVITASPGDIVVINEYDIHRFLIDLDGTRIRIIQFAASLFINLEVPLKPLKTHIKSEEIKAVPNLESYLNSLFEIMEAENGIVTNGKENPFSQNLTVSLYYILMRHFSQEGYAQRKKKERDEFYAVVEYIKENFTKEIKVTDIAKKFYMSKTKLSLLFKKYSGLCVNEYINTLRVKKVNFMLSQGNTITYAALESGFQSIRTFNYTYKKLFGVPPSERMKLQ